MREKSRNSIETWSILDHLRHDPRDVPLLREWFEPLLVQTFLDGLNSEFNLRSQLIQATADWPTLDQAISSILEEETWLANQITTSQTNVDSRAALSSVKQIQSPGTSRNEQANATRFDYRESLRWCVTTVKNQAI